MNYKDLFARLEKTLDQIQRSDDTLGTLSAILRRLVDEHGADLGLAGGRIYVREEDEFVLCDDYPSTRSHVGYRLPVSYRPVQELLQQGFVLHELSDPEIDRSIEEALGVSTFAAIYVGDTRQRIIAFSLEHSSDRQHVIYSLNTIRHVVNLKLSKERLEDRFAEARSIQLSLLPSAPPIFGDYDLWARTAPAEEVGGDLFDFIEVSARSLGIAIADSAGHGLPAALQARDAIIGLRMGVEERWRITATIEKLNKVVGRSANVSRFISLFYCEVERNGTLVYCNAGHNPPLLYRQGVLSELKRGGLILGPNPDAVYERGHEIMEPGSILFAYTDGITEAANPEHEMFGVERVKSIIAGRRWTSARELVDAVFAATTAFCMGLPPEDDRTALAVLRVPGSDQALSARSR